MPSHRGTTAGRNRYRSATVSRNVFCPVAISAPIWTVATIVIMAILTAGCGPRGPHSALPWSTANVTIRSGDLPFRDAEVMLVASSDSTGVDAGGVLDAAGTATIPVLPGRYRVVVQPLPPSQEELDRPSSARRPAPSSIPASFRSPKTSPCQIKVRPRTQHAFTVDLDSGSVR
jgi:hypothetical protein